MDKHPKLDFSLERLLSLKDRIPVLYIYDKDHPFIVYHMVIADPSVEIGNIRCLCGAPIKIIGGHKYDNILYNYEDRVVATSQEVIVGECTECRGGIAVSIIDVPELNYRIILMQYYIPEPQVLKRIIKRLMETIRDMPESLAWVLATEIYLEVKIKKTLRLKLS